jgi:hypothetical protein
MRALVIALVLGCTHPYTPVEAAHLQAHGMRVGAAAPDAQLRTSSGSTVALRDVLRRSDRTIVVFYRGFY